MEREESENTKTGEMGLPQVGNCRLSGNEGEIQEIFVNWEAPKTFSGLDFHVSNRIIRHSNINFQLTTQSFDIFP